MIQIHPCKLCLVKACCAKPCSIYSKFRDRYETFIYTAALVLSVTIVNVVLVLASQLAKTPIIGVVSALVVFYVILIGTVIKGSEDYNEDLNRNEKIFFWVCGPVFLIYTVLIVIVERTWIGKYPRKHQPYTIL